MFLVVDLITDLGKVKKILTKFMKVFSFKKFFTPGRIGLKFDIFELMFYEILGMYIHNSHLV